MPTLILSRTGTEGAVYIGGFKAAVNSAFLKEENVTHIVNAAGKKLGMMFGPKFRVITPFSLFLAIPSLRGRYVYVGVEQFKLQIKRHHDVIGGIIHICNRHLSTTITINTYK